MQICKMEETISENEDSKHVVEQFIKKEKKIWNGIDFNLNSSNDFDHSSPSTTIKMECESVPLEDNSNIEVQTSVKEETEDEVPQFISETTSKIWNKKNPWCPEVNDVTHSSPSTTIKIECASVPLENNSNREVQTSVKEENEDEVSQFISETTSKIWGRKNPCSPEVDDSNRREPEILVKEETKDEILQFIDATTGKIWNREDTSLLEDCIKKKTYPHIIPEDKEVMPQILCESALKKSCLKDPLFDCSATQKSDVKFHEPGVPLEEKPLKCHLCGFSTNKKYYLKKHIQIHINMKEKPYKCHLCDYSATEKRNLKGHIVCVHLKEKPFKCYLCDYNATLKRQLRDHIISNHLNEKPNKCHLCDYSATQKSHLKNHIASIHLKEKPYKCYLCDYRATQKQRVKEHIGSIHMNEKPYKCHLCDYSATNKQSLKRHTASVHLKERHYECDFCVYSAYKKSDIARHIGSVHRQLQCNSKGQS